MPRAPYIFTAAIILAVLNIFCHETASGQAAKNVKINAVVSATAETAINKGAAGKTGEVGLKKEVEKKKKLSLKTTVYIFDTIVSGLMHLLIGTGLFMIVLIILKWFFIMRKVE